MRRKQIANRHESLAADKTPRARWHVSILPGAECSIQHHDSSDSCDVWSYRTDTIEEDTTMSRTASLAGRVCLIGLGLAVGPLVAGCSSDRSYRPQPDTTNVVHRPIYGTDGDQDLVPWRIRRCKLRLRCQTRPVTRPSPRPERYGTRKRCAASNLAAFLSPTQARRKDFLPLGSIHGPFYNH